MEVTIQPSSNWEPLAGEEEPRGRRSRGSIVKREEFAKREGTLRGEWGALLKLLHGEKEVESKSFTFCFVNCFATRRIKTAEVARTTKCKFKIHT